MSHLVLDIDGTLIDNKEEKIDGIESFEFKCKEFTCYIYKRPHLDEFLDYCFDKFDSVSIWTAASKGWMDIVLTNIINEKHSKQFLFTYSWEMCSWKYAYIGCYSSQSVCIKKLKKNVEE